MYSANEKRYEKAEFNKCGVSIKCIRQNRVGWIYIIPRVIPRRINFKASEFLIEQDGVAQISAVSVIWNWVFRKDGA